MARPLYNWVKVLGCLLFLSTLTGCLDAKVVIKFVNFTSGTLDASYQLPWEVVNIESGASGLKSPLPQTQDQWTTLVQRVPGLVMTSFIRTETPEGLSCTLALSFSNLRSLEGIFTALGHKLTVLENSGVYTLNFQPGPLSIESWPADLRTLVVGRFGEGAFTMDITVPKDIRAASDGVISENRRTLRYTKTLGTYLRAPINEARVSW